ncbi:MAG: leucine-rich repeat domain-containing protein, partial [Lachnospiraceae bacterium]|nr:leucine-rich repeat domain-containing protein [Lachnospiraceae bacterium]
MNRKIFKSLSALLLLTAIAVTQVPVSDVEAVTVAIESDFEMDGDKLMKYTGTAEVVSIPVGVKVIGEEAFAGNDHVIKVVVDEEVESIGYRAFADCDNLRTIVVGDGVEKIGTAAFSNDKELINVTLGAGVKSLGT